MPVLKVWTMDRKIRKAIIMHEMKLKKLKEKICEKFGYSAETILNIYIENDGTLIDEDELLEAYKDEILIIGKNEEEWVAGVRQGSLSPSSNDDEDENAPSSSKLATMLKNMREKNRRIQEGGQKKKTFRKDIRLQLGWMNYCSSTQRWQQVKAPMEGGIRYPAMNPSSSYEDVLNKAKELFFPQGFNRKGKLTDMEVSLGDFAERKIKKTQFPLEKYITEECLTQKPRIYLMTKEKEEVLQLKRKGPQKRKKKGIFNMSSSSYSSDELPDPAAFGNVGKCKKFLASSSEQKPDETILQFRNESTIQSAQPCLPISSSEKANICSTPPQNRPPSMKESEPLPGPSSSMCQPLFPSVSISSTEVNEDLNLNLNQPQNRQMMKHLQNLDNIQFNSSEIVAELQSTPLQNGPTVKGQYYSTPTGEIVITHRFPICSICIDRAVDCCTIPCGHLFCRPCITQVQESTEQRICPTCREDFQEINPVFM